MGIVFNWTIRIISLSFFVLSFRRVAEKSFMEVSTTLWLGRQFNEVVRRKKIFITWNRLRDSINLLHKV